MEIRAIATSPSARPSNAKSRCRKKPRSTPTPKPRRERRRSRRKADGEDHGEHSLINPRRPPRSKERGGYYSSGPLLAIDYKEIPCKMNIGDRPAFPQPYPPQAFQKVLAFVDGTSLQYRLDAERLLIYNLSNIIRKACLPRELMRTCFYTSPPHLDRIRATNGDSYLDGCRVVLGDAIPTGDGNVKEKGVDARLVADLVYNAASKNCDMIAILTHDTDFCHPLSRIEDFGCRTFLIAIGPDAPDRLQFVADKYLHIDKTTLLQQELATER